MLVRARVGWAVVAVATAACSLQEASNRQDSTTGVTQKATTRGWNPNTWQAPVVDSTPDDPYETAVYRGLALITHTKDSLPGYNGSALNCTSCHLDEGRRQLNASSLPAPPIRERRECQAVTGAEIPL